METTKILEAYCIGYKFGDSTDKIAENIQKYVNEKYSIWLMDELEAEFDLFCATRHSSISAYIIRRLYILLNKKNANPIAKNSILYLFLNITLMKKLALKIESELMSRPEIMYPAGVAKRANWNMILSAYCSTHSFLAESMFLVKNNKQRIHGWQIFENIENLEHLNNIFYPIAPISCFMMNSIFNVIHNIKRSPQIQKPVAVSFQNRKNLPNFSENATFAIYFET